MTVYSIFGLLNEYYRFVRNTYNPTYTIQKTCLENFNGNKQENSSLSLHLEQISRSKNRIFLVVRRCTNLKVRKQHNHKYYEVFIILSSEIPYVTLRLKSVVLWYFLLFIYTHRTL